MFDRNLMAGAGRLRSVNLQRAPAGRRGLQSRLAKAFVALSFLVALVACSASDTAPGLAAPTAPQQSPNDSFAYRLLELDNELKVLLISNPDTPKAAASLDVQVGSGENPDGRGGLAHFLEHMLFLGTEKYPDAAEYERYLTEHGGSRNAYTSFEHTNYFFDVDPEHFDGALDRFAQFFIAPRFDEQYVQRERNAVQAEYQMGINSEPRRGLDVMQATMNPEHPFSQLAVGTVDTLADRSGSPVRDELIDFYREYYSANLMRLAVLGSESLDELEAMVRKRFAAVPNRDVELAEITAPMFVDAQLPMLVKVEPQGTLRQLEVNFQIPDYRDDYVAKPMAYVSNLVGHEGEGSLLSLLKRKGLAEGLSSGVGFEWRGGALFSVSVSLTERGVGRYEEVLQDLFSYLDLLRSAPPEERIYREQSLLAELAFRFREPMPPSAYVRSLSDTMHYYDDADLLRGPYMMGRFEPDTIKAALTRLTPEKAQVILTAPELKGDRTSPYYDASYTRLGPEALMLANWRGGDASELALPAANPFIAEDTTLLAIDEENPALPELRVDEPRKRIWFRQAEQFRVPKGSLYMSFRSPLVAQSAPQKAAAELYTRMVSDALNEYTYPARLAGLGFSFYGHGQGISMRVNGYNDKQLMLLEALLGTIGEQTLSEARFERLRREMVLELQNTVARRPTSRLVSDLRRAIAPGTFDDASLIAALNAMDVEALGAYVNDFWRSARAEALVYGNFSPATPDAIAAALDLVLRGDDGLPALAPQVIQLAGGENLELRSAIDHDDTVVVWYLQGGAQNWADRAGAALTGQAVRSGFFQQLRTEQQLGYIVQSFVWTQFDVPGLALLVQSPSHSASDVVNAMQTFLVDTQSDIDAQQYARHQQALINDILKPHENLGERAEFYWQSIATREWGFDGRQQLADAVAAMSFEDWQRYYETHFLTQRGSVLAMSPGARGFDEQLDEQADDRPVFTVPEELRAGHAMYRIDLDPL